MSIGIETLSASFASWASAINAMVCGITNARLLPSTHVDAGLRMIASGVGRAVLDELRTRYPKSWPRLAARPLGARADASEIEVRVVQDAHRALKLMLAVWDELFADRLGDRERAWALELLATRNAWAHLEEISIRDVLHTLDVAELLLAAIDAPEAQDVRRLSARLRRRRSARRMIASAVAGATATLAILMLGLALLGRDDARALPSSLAGPWPSLWPTDLTFVANLTQRFPFELGTMAAHDDVLLVRTRLAIKTDRRRASAIYSLDVPPRTERYASIDVALATPGQLKASTRRMMVKLAPSLRLRRMPGTTRLLDAHGRVLGNLHDPSEVTDVLIPRLATGVYYVEMRLRAALVPHGARGQISSGGPLECRGDRGRSAGPVTAPGSPLLCRARLLNLGPRTLERVLVRLSYEPDRTMASLIATVTAPDAKPRTTRLAGAAMPRRGEVRAVEFVPRSARLLTASRKWIGGYDVNPFRHAVDVDELRAGAKHARYLEFSIRLR